MAITIEQGDKMTIEAAAGLEKTTVPGEEAAAFYAKLKKEVRDMMTAGYMPLCSDD